MKSWRTLREYEGCSHDSTVVMYSLDQGGLHSCWVRAVGPLMQQSAGSPLASAYQVLPTRPQTAPPWLKGGSIAVAIEAKALLRPEKEVEETNPPNV